MIALGFIASFLAGAITLLGALGLMAAWKERQAKREMARLLELGKSKALEFIESENGREFLAEIHRDRDAR